MWPQLVAQPLSLGILLRNPGSQLLPSGPLLWRSPGEPCPFPEPGLGSLRPLGWVTPPQCFPEPLSLGDSPPRGALLSGISVGGLRAVGWPGQSRGGGAPLPTLGDLPEGLCPPVHDQAVAPSAGGPPFLHGGQLVPGHLGAGHAHLTPV